MDTTQTITHRTFLAGLNTGSSSAEFEHSMEELKELAKALDLEVVGIFTQNLPNPIAATYIGSGKIAEIKEQIMIQEVDTIVFDEMLSPIQLRNLADDLEITILDRTSLILRIFEQRARTKEAMLQVELANLQYMLPRLVGLHTSLSRQGGGSGSLSNKGAGETKIELDRRHIEKRITELKRSLEDVARERQVTRSSREQSGIPRVALVGYTNAGKSTMMNWMLDAFSDHADKKVFEKDMLFATLDTTIRKITPGNGNPPFLLSDTVGFINKLPHSLVKAFHSTLEEVTFADIILQIIDASDEHCSDHIQVTRDTLKELRNRGIKISLGSSSKNAKFILEKVELIDLFDAISDGTNITKSKPDPEVFLKGAEFLGIAPEDCVVVEDADAGIEAAVAGGMHPAGIGEARDYVKTEFKLDTFADLLKMF